MEFSSRVSLTAIVAIVAVVLPGARCTGYCKAPGGCPDYTVTSSNDDFEVRSYAPTKWVSTTIEGGDYEAAMSTAFERLYKYISQNKIEMTTPVTTVFDGNKYTISFYIPPVNQTNAPEPTDSTVFLQTKGPFTVYVYQYGGWSPRGTAAVVSQADSVAAKVKAAGKAIKEGTFVSAGYNSPMDQTDRHNEVWIMPADTPAIQASTGNRRLLL